MKAFLSALHRTSALMNIVGGIALILIMLLTAADVLLRIFGRPITGTYELVSLGGAMVVGFAIPQTTWDNANVAVEFFVEGRSKRIRDIMFVFSKGLGIILFVLIGIFLYEKANDLYADGFVTSTLKVPFYPVAYGLSFCCFVESLTLLGQIVGRFGGEVADE